MLDKILLENLKEIPIYYRTATKIDYSLESEKRKFTKSVHIGKEGVRGYSVYKYHKPITRYEE